MKEKYNSISQYLIALKQRISIHAIINFADCLVAGIIGAVSAVKNDHPFISSKIPGRILTGLLVLILPRVKNNLIVQAAGNVSYQGGKTNLIPATIICQQIISPGLTLNSLQTY